MARTSDQDLLLRVSELAFTYPEVGATAGTNLPPGYRHVDRSSTLGRGHQVYARACAGLLSWQMHRKAGIAISATAPTAITGTSVLLTIGRRPIALTAACRVVYEVTTEQQTGFAYGTLPGHPETGEESFVVTYQDDDNVIFTVRAFSRPVTVLARAGGPLTRLAQDLATNRYLNALSAIAR